MNLLTLQNFNIDRDLYVIVALKKKKEDWEDVFKIDFK